MAITSVKTGSSFTSLQKYDSMLAGNTAYDPSATFLIQRIAGTGASVTFSSIPSTYASLQIRFTYKDTSTTDWAATSAYVYYRFNGATTNYRKHYLIGNGTAASAGADITGTGLNVYGSYMSSNATYANMVGVGIIDIHDYASTTKNKTTRHIAGDDANGNGTTNRTITLSSGLWESTAAITSITLYPGDTGFATGSTFALYGMKG